MTRALVAAALAVAAPALAEAPPRAPAAQHAPATQHAPAAPPAARAAPAPAPASPPAGAPPASAPKGPKELEQAKKLGRQGLGKLAPKLGKRAEKLANDKGGDVVDRAVDLAAEAAGLVPRKK